MNGVHDMGGMHGMGAIAVDKNEPVFHAAWEGRAYGLTRAMGGWRLWNLDATRFQRELIAPVDYFRMSYYERWIAALRELMLKNQLVTRTELSSGRPDEGAALRTPVFTADKVPGLWKEWAASLADELNVDAQLGEPDDGSRYYHCWLTTLERLVVDKRLADAAALLARKEAWAEAYRHTPHGKPVELENESGC
jgi:hypothetical protein